MSGHAEKQIRPCAIATPVIYGFSTPGVTYHDGWLKIGYTERSAEERKREIFGTGWIKAVTEFVGNALYEADPDTGFADVFQDRAFHAYLVANGIERATSDSGFDPEWFRISPEDAKRLLNAFRERKAVLPEGEPEAYELRPEQERAVAATAAAYAAGAGEFLWNAKPRFGKTLATYDLMKRAGMERILVVTNRPAVADAWHSDYVRFVGGKSGTAFVSGNKAVAKEKFVTDPEQAGVPVRAIAFTSLQDLKGAGWAGGKFGKLDWIRDTEWDMLVIDESHEGASTDRADAALAAIRRRFTLWLSGTPFKQIASGQFPGDRIFDWTYGDEQEAKASWSGDTRNPYEEMPRLSLYTYKISDLVRDEIAEGFDEDGREWTFDLGEFFSTRNGSFVHEASVDRFLDALSSQEKFPFSSYFRDPDDPDRELRHTFWLLDRVDSARALGRKLEAHPVFSKYNVIVAAGDGREYDPSLTQSDIKNVRNAITDDAWHTRTITISVGKLTTGVTIPELTGILMLCNVESPEKYMQTAFRAQNPCLFRDGSNRHRKLNAYVFDFDPARTLSMFGAFADGLCPGGAAKDDAERKRRIGELLNFFPVIGEDPDGEMVELDAERVLAVPREIYAARVVETGFMANCLFRNVGAVFSAPAVVSDLLGKLTAVKEPKRKKAAAPDVSGVDLDPDTGAVSPSTEAVIGRYAALFGDKVYAPSKEDTDAAEAILAKSVPSDGDRMDGDDGTDATVEALVEAVVGPSVQQGVIAPVLEKYGGDLKKRELSNIEAKIKAKAAAAAAEVLKPVADGFKARHDDIVAAFVPGTDQACYQSDLAEALADAGRSAAEAVAGVVEVARADAARECEAAAQRKKKATAEEQVRDKLRGFSRTIPAFLMAYGTPNTTLATFDRDIPDDVFETVMGITMDEFRFLRDGGDFPDPETGGTKRFEGGMFDEGVFDGAVRLFMRKRKELANWFDESLPGDIFDYIPPQRTNQIFTPRAVVKRMVDALGDENPGIFDDPNATFIDLHMKSGMFVTEIAKRLYASCKLAEAYPDGADRLKHIFERQLYGLAPTEIIYNIAMAYIFGFDADGSIDHCKNFKQIDAAVHAKAGMLREALDEAFGGASAVDKEAGDEG